MLGGRSFPRPGFGAVLALLLSLGCAGLAARGSQEPVTTSVDLLDQVRRLKAMGGRVHLEWLYLENRVDARPDQKDLVRSGRPLEFGDGLLYHGRDGLDEALKFGRVTGPSYLTRAPHVWAVGPFHDGSRSPAIFVISALDFDRLLEERKAVLEAEVDREAGIMDPYPRILDGFPLDMVREIWIDRDTADRYEKLCARPRSDLSGEEGSLASAVAAWRTSGKLIVIPGLRHTGLSTDVFYPAAYEAVGAHFVGGKLVERIPAFRPR